MRSDLLELLAIKYAHLVTEPPMAPGRLAAYSDMNWKKIGIIAGAGILLGSVVGFTVYQSRKNVVAVQSGRLVIVPSKGALYTVFCRTSEA